MLREFPYYRVSSFVPCLLAVCVLPGLLWGDPGFGAVRKRKLTLEIRQPAVVRLANTSFYISGSADRAYSSALDTLLTTLETELVSNEKTLVKKPQGEAEYVIALRITTFSALPPQQRMVGNTNYVHLTGSLRVAYQVLGRGGKVFDAGNVGHTYDQDVQPPAADPITGAMRKIPIPGVKKTQSGQAPQTADDLKQLLVDEVVRQIATKLGNTKQSIEVEIAGGDDRLNRAADFMDKQLWSRALDELEKTPAFAKPESEAYRQYDLGLVHEAMSYEGKSLSEQRQNLLDAQEYYDKALEMNRKEKYFVSSVARVKDALARHKTFEDMQKAEQRSVSAQTKTVPAPDPPAAQPPPARVAPPPTQAKAEPVKQTTPQPKAVPPRANEQRPPAVKQAAPVTAAQNASAANTAAARVPPAQANAIGPKTLRIGDVIEMFTANVPEDQIVAIIRNSAIQFDPVDKDTAIAIARARLPVSLQNEMRRKVGAPLLGPAKK
jgi:hypothetical protein